MAGSYRSCCKEDGTFDDEGFTEVIENLSDAHEACEMMHWMINDLAKELSKFGYRSSENVIEETEEAYYRYIRSGDEYIG